MADLKASEKIGNFVASVRAEEISEDLVHRVARTFIDTFAVAAAGREEDASRIAREYALAGGGAPQSYLWATPHRVRAEEAALANGVTGHVLDYDDVAFPLTGHPSVVLHPAIVALGEALGATGGQIAAAYAVGYEVDQKMGRTMSTKHYSRGWHCTATVGILGATAGCSHLLGLDAQRTAMAMGIAVAHVSGVMRSFGTMAKPLQPGNAAASAVRAARLAAAGFTSSIDALDGPAGYMAVYGSGEDLHANLDTLGQEPWELVSNGVEVKKYPCCYDNQRAIQATLDLVSERPIDPEQVERIRVTVHPGGLLPLIHRRATTGLEGKFCPEYAVSAALLDRTVGPGTFTDQAVQRPEAQALLRKVERAEDVGEFRPHRAMVEVALRNGERRTRRVEELRGSPRLPLTDAELEAKLRDCVSFAELEMDVAAFLSAVWDWRQRPISSILEMATGQAH